MKVAIALLLAVAAAVLSAVALGLIAGSMLAWIAPASLALGASVGGFSLWQSRKGPRENWEIDPFGSLTLVAFALFALRSFLWLVFEAGDELWVFSPNNLGDFALHLTYVRYFAAGAPFWPENPIFAGSPLTYPIGMDLFNALLAMVGVHELRGFIAVGLVASACTMAALWRWGRGFVVAGFLFAGGAFGFAIFVRLELVDYQADAAWEDITVAWKSLPLALFVTQRGLLFAIPAGLMLLASWRARFLESGKPSHRLPAWSEWLLYTAMPVFHLHTFLFLSIIAAWWFLALAPARRHLAAIVAFAFFPAAIQAWLITAGFSGTSMIGLLVGWMQPPLQPDASFVSWALDVIAFWLENFLILPVLVAWLLVRLISRGGPLSAWLTALPSIAVFLLCCIVRFAPWEWDNTKLMIWAYLLILPVLWQEIIAPRNEWIRGLLCFLLFFSGAVSLAGGLTGRPIVGTTQDREQQNQPLIGYSLGVRSEIDGTRWATRDIPINDAFIAHPNYNHPLLLSGRVLAMGYEGHAWSHGLDYQDRLAAVKSILQGESDWREDVNSLGLRWLFWGEQEEANYPNSKQPWKADSKLYASGPWGAIYDLSQPAEPNPEL